MHSLLKFQKAHRYNLSTSEVQGILSKCMLKPDETPDSEIPFAFT